MRYTNLFDNASNTKELASLVLARRSHNEVTLHTYKRAVNANELLCVSGLRFLDEATKVSEGVKPRK